MPIKRTREGQEPSGGAEPGRSIVQIGNTFVEYTGQAPTQADLDAYNAPPPDTRPGKGNSQAGGIPGLRDDINAIWDVLEQAGVVKPLMPEEVIDIKAREDNALNKAEMSAHIAVCEVIREQQLEAAKINREEHRLIISKIENISELLGKYDKNAIIRWVAFGGTLLTILAVAIFNHLLGKGP